jgi:hypothetical protein
MDKELIVIKGKVIEQQKSYTADSGKEIGYEAGAKMVKRHFDENPDDVIAHFIGRNIIEQLLAQPGCVGIRAFYGLNDLGIKSLVLVGVDYAGNNILELEGRNQLAKTNMTKGFVMSGVKSCPPYCGDSDSTSTWW